MKTCRKCGETKPLDAFHRTTSKDGRKARCADCDNAEKRARRERLRRDRYDMDVISSCGYRSENSSADVDSIGNSGPEIEVYARW